MSSERAWAPALSGAAGQQGDASARGYAAGYAAGWSAASRAAAEQAARQREEEARLAAEARAQAAGRLERALGVLDAAAQAARARVAPVLEEAAEEIVAASVELAEAALGEELRDGARAARTALRRALANDPSRELVRIHLCPADLDLLRGAASDAEAGLVLPVGVDLVPDPDLSPGDAVGEFEHGVLDARLGQAVARAREALGVTR
jgi:flagellar assembly protein FliH